MSVWAEKSPAARLPAETQTLFFLFYLSGGIENVDIDAHKGILNVSFMLREVQ